ncbi:SRPBCC family protein [Nonomuraea roseoviolacea subsp. roseoviolacea]|uniref:Ligand-binding SRPBCC domain-containing protein n=1 Tax=Nonomuraea roseoviolacea subsp. carminata TaxID=160689 RepID=A0ABT1KAZ9_9ACTN|nr:SRPBCC family protein [Nonomuraea roseoviolacea]MCP2351130.1 ligand-binding SRPBCC domain-containing protein [Nonomuraea roseoviolacea subsp. carminata]
MFLWSFEHSAETTAPAETVWALYADVPGWVRWDTGLERAELHGPFAAGSEIVMTPQGQDEVRARITRADENDTFADETVFGEVVLRFTHTLEPFAGGTRVTHRLEVTGPGAEEIGPAVAADLPDAVAALVKLAETA